MKNFLLISNLVLLFLVGYLYLQHFNATNTVSAHPAKQNNFSQNNNTPKVAYIELDSLQNNYAYYKKIKVEMDRRQEASSTEIAGMQKRYQTRAMQLQQKGPTMSQQEQDAAMKEISQMQQELQSKKQELDNELYNYTSKMKDDLLSRIQNYLKEYNKDGKYAYIISYEPELMFYKDTSLNITKDVVVGLNEDYEKSKK